MLLIPIWSIFSRRSYATSGQRGPMCNCNPKSNLREWIFVPFDYRQSFIVTIFFQQATGARNMEVFIQSNPMQSIEDTHRVMSELTFPDIMASLCHDEKPIEFQT